MLYFSLYISLDLACVLFVCKFEFFLFVLLYATYPEDKEGLIHSYYGSICIILIQSVYVLLEIGNFLWITLPFVSG